MFFIFQPDIEPDRCALNNVYYRYWILDLRVYFRHAPARLRVDAIVFALAHDYAAVCLLSLLFTQGATQAVCGVRLTVKGCRNATSTHETISRSIDPPLLLSGANY